MTRDAVGIGIVGLGFIGRAHAACCRDIEGAALVAVADVDEGRRHAAARELGVTGYADYREMLERQDLDAVIVCLPDHLHAAPCEAAAQAGKHILLEKPIASTLPDAERILKTVAEHRVRLMVGHSARFNYQYAAFREKVKRGEIGAPVHGWVRRNGRIIDGRRFQGNTSVVLFLAVHDIDFLRWCVGSEVVRVYAQANRRLLRDLGVDDSVLSILTFADGFIASMEHSWIHPEKFPSVIDAKAELVGERGVVSLDGFNHGLTSWTESGADFSPPRDFLGEVRNSLHEELRHYVNCLRKDREFLVSPDDAYQALRVALAIHRSLEIQAPVELS